MKKAKNKTFKAINPTFGVGLKKLKKNYKFVK